MPRIDSVVDDFLADKGKGADSDSGTYRRDAGRELERFVDFLGGRDESVKTFAELSADHLRSYARHLASQGWATGTVTTYYAYVSAFCGWAVREGYLAENVAQRARAREPLPEDAGRNRTEQQSWSPEDRRALTRHVDRVAHDAVDEVASDRRGAIKACRDRALVYLLAYSGVRGAEVFAHRDDDRREGISWRDVDLADRYVRVLSKKQAWDDRGLPQPVVRPLSAYRRVLDPPGDDWPVFPTFHRPTLAAVVDDELAARGFDDEAVAGAKADGESLFAVCLEYDVAPPSITTDAARSILRRLCDEADIDLDGGADYLQPHGARRGAGEVLVRTFGHAAAARALDNSEEVVRDHYSHIEAGELAEQMTAAFEEVDAPVGSRGSAEVGGGARDGGDGDGRGDDAQRS